MTSREVKEIAYKLGAELCGIAGPDRFADAPEGYQIGRASGRERVCLYV